MADLSFIPAAPSSKPTLEFQPTSLPEKKTEFGINSFDQFLKTANERQFKTDSFQERLKKPHSSEERNAKSGPKKDEFRTAAEKVAPQSDQNQKADTDSETKEASGAQYENTEKKVAAENSDEAEQKIEENANQEELLALLAYLTEAEAVIRGETQAETIQTVEFNQVMASVEGVANGQVVSISDGNKLEGEIPVINATEANSVKPNPGISIVENLVDLSQIQVLSEGSENSAPSEGESFNNQEQNPDAKGQISELVKVNSNANQKNGDESLTFDRIVFADSQKAEVDSQLGGELIIAPHGQSVEKGGKVDLALIQTHLAVNDEADGLKAEIPVLNVIPGQPSFNNVSQIQAFGSTEVTSANKEELFSQIVEQAKVVINNGGSEMEVNLKPEHLGRLQLKVTIENEVVTAKFVAESQQVKEIIESNLSQLRRSLQENGMQVDMIMVSVGYQQSNESFDQAAYNREGLKDFGGAIGQANDGRETKVEERNSPVEHDGLIDLIA